MKKVSKHWADVYKWIDKVVDSCKTMSQCQICENLIDNFYSTYSSRLGVRDCHNLRRELDIKLIEIQFKIQNGKILK